MVMSPSVGAAAGCRVGSIGPIAAGWAGPEGVRCTAPAHAPRISVTVAAVGAVAVGHFPPSFTYLAAGDDLRAGGRRSELAAIPFAISTDGSMEGVVAATEGIGGEMLHSRCSVAASGQSAGVAAVNGGGGAGGGGRGVAADPGAGPGATLCAPLPPAAAGFTVLTLTPPTGGFFGTAVVGGASAGAEGGVGLLLRSSTPDVLLGPKP